MWVGRVGIVECNGGKVGEMGVVVTGIGVGGGSDLKWERYVVVWPGGFSCGISLDSELGVDFWFGVDNAIGCSLTGKEAVIQSPVQALACAGY